MNRGIYPSVPGGRVWTSEHWSNGIYRELRLLAHQRDPYDPTGWSVLRGNGDVILHGDGTAKLIGNPRLYLYDEAQALTWGNVEISFEAELVQLEPNPRSFAGIQPAARSEHQAVPPNNNGQTYFASFLFDTRGGFVKEVIHGGYTSNRTPGGVNAPWPGGAFPLGEWHRYTFAAYNVQCGVRLEQYIDGVLLSELVDAGDWTNYSSSQDPQTAINYDIDPLAPFDQPATSVYLRTDDVVSLLVRDWVVREIAP